jgi:hypothetical protein
MSENTIISGWSIKQGDFKVDAEYDEQYVKDRKLKKLFNKVMLIISGVAGIFFILLLSNLAGKL